MQDSEADLIEALATYFEIVEEDGDAARYLESLGPAAEAVLCYASLARELGGLLAGIPRSTGHPSSDWLYRSIVP